MTEPLYSLTNVSKCFVQGGAVVTAVDSVTFDVRAGEFMVIQGTSGSGKTTLLQLLGGLDAVTSGKLSFEGHDMGGMSDRALTSLRLHGIGFVFQNYSLVPTLTAAENVWAALAPTTTPSKARVRASELLAQVGLSTRAAHLPRQMSGGEQQRVAIARALANRPKVILADEPTGNLDSARGREIVDILMSLSTEHGITVLVVTHDPEIARVAPRVLHMQDGGVASPDRPD